MARDVFDDSPDDQLSWEQYSDAAVAAVEFKLKSNVVAGTTATTNIAISGIATTDRLVAVVRFNVEADTGDNASGDKVADVSDLLSEASITSAGNIQLSTTNTTGDKLLVIWYDQSATS